MTRRFNFLFSTAIVNSFVDKLVVVCDKLFQQRSLRETGAIMAHRSVLWPSWWGSWGEGRCSYHSTSLGASRGLRVQTCTQLACFVLCHPGYHCQGYGPTHIISSIKITPHRRAQTHLTGSVKWTINIKHRLWISIIFVWPYFCHWNGKAYRETDFFYRESDAFIFLKIFIWGF